MEENKYKAALSVKDIDRIIEMAWEDQTTFDAIEMQFGLKEKEVIARQGYQACGIEKR